MESSSIYVTRNNEDERSTGCFAATSSLSSVNLTKVRNCALVALNDFNGYSIDRRNDGVRDSNDNTCDRRGSKKLGSNLAKFVYELRKNDLNGVETSLLLSVFTDDVGNFLRKHGHVLERNASCEDEFSQLVDACARAKAPIYSQSDNGNFCSLTLSRVVASSRGEIRSASGGASNKLMFPIPTENVKRIASRIAASFDGALENRGNAVVDVTPNESLLLSLKRGGTVLNASTDQYIIEIETIVPISVQLLCAYGRLNIVEPRLFPAERSGRRM